MKTHDAKAEFEQFLTRSGATLDGLSPTLAIRLISDFYRQVRAEDCHLDEDGDMLSYQWGTYDWGQGRTFQFELARQFIENGTEDDDGISQLALVFHFAPSPEFDALESGNEWCYSPEELDQFAATITSSEAFYAVAALTPERVVLEYGGV
jgi:hypothetical protein